MKSSLSKGVGLRNSKRRRRSLGQRVYQVFDDKKDYFTKYNIKYEVIEKKKEKKKPKIRSIKLSSVNKKEPVKETKSKVEKEIDLFAVEGEIFKKEPKKEPKTETKTEPKTEPKKDTKTDTKKDTKTDTKTETKKEPKTETKKEKIKGSQEGGIDSSIKKIFVTTFDAEGDKNQLVL
jgi:hypothetical protein